MLKPRNRIQICWFASTFSIQREVLSFEESEKEIYNSAKRTSKAFFRSIYAIVLMAFTSKSTSMKLRSLVPTINLKRVY